MKTRTQQFLDALRRLDAADRRLQQSRDPATLLEAAETEAEAMDALDRLFETTSLKSNGNNRHRDRVEAA
jgi:hypothetical protein